MTGDLTPERAVRLLRAKVGELETQVHDTAELYGGLRPVDAVVADIALVADILAWFIEQSGWTASAEVERG